MPQIDCPGCERALRVPERYLGRFGHCKFCGHRFTPRIEPEEAPARGAPAQANAPAPFSFEDFPAPPAATAKEGNGGQGAPARRAGRFALWRGAAKASAPAPVEKVTPLEALLRWLEELPRTHPSFRELEERRSKPLFLSNDDLARSKAYFDVPLLLARQHEALVIVKTTQSNIAPGTPQAVSSGDMDVEASYYAAPEYPVVRLLFTIKDNPDRPLKFESVPLLTDGNALEFFAMALREHRIGFALYAGSQSNHVATAELKLDEETVRALGNALVGALKQWRKTRPQPAEHDPAVKRFAREIPL